MQVKVKRLCERARLPFRATQGSAGADLFACIDEDITIAPNERVLIPTGIAIELESAETGAFIFPRSSLSSKHGISLSNCVGVIDSDYRGEVKIPVINHSLEPYTIHDGERIAQLVVLPVVLPLFIETENLNDTQRADGGFGSTGV